MINIIIISSSLSNHNPNLFFLSSALLALLRAVRARLRTGIPSSRATLAQRATAPRTLARTHEGMKLRRCGGTRSRRMPRMPAHTHARTHARHGTAWHGTARHGTAWHDMAWHVDTTTARSVRHAPRLRRPQQWNASRRHRK